jgi:hypothetical protein
VDGDVRKLGLRIVQLGADGERRSNDVYGSGGDSDRKFGDGDGDFGDGQYEVGLGDDYDYGAAGGCGHVCGTASVITGACGDDEHNGQCGERQRERRGEVDGDVRQFIVRIVQPGIDG